MNRQEQKEIMKEAGGFCINCDEDIKSIDIILNELERLQKENEELKEKYDIDIDELENLLSDTTVEMLDWRNKSIKLEAENRELKTLIAHKNGYRKQLEQGLYTKENIIPILLESLEEEE